MKRDHKGDTPGKVSYCPALSVVPDAGSFRKKSVASVVQFGIHDSIDLSPAGGGRVGWGTRTEVSWG
jgi:hypothetical protein